LLGYLALLSWVWPGGMHFQGAFRGLGVSWWLWGFAFSIASCWALGAGLEAYLALLAASWINFLLKLRYWRRHDQEAHQQERQSDRLA
jgi:hypothetical protein